MNDLFSVAGKVVVITGGSRGIGAMMARGFVEAGAKTYITARKESELKEAANNLSQYGECVAVSADLSSMDGIKQLVKNIQQCESHIDVLVNNAGATWGANLDVFPENGWDKVMDLNVKSPFFLIQGFLPLLTRAASSENPARIINIASMNGITNPKMNNYSYSTSKAAVIHMTRHLAADLSERAITVNAIAPGLFLSRMTAYAVEGNEAAIEQSIPLGRLGSPEDAAGTAIYLASRASAWMTGHTMVLDGGQVACAG